MKLTYWVKMRVVVGFNVSISRPAHTVATPSERTSLSACLRLVSRKPNKVGLKLLKYQYVHDSYCIPSHTNAECQRPVGSLLFKE